MQVIVADAATRPSSLPVPLPGRAVVWVIEEGTASDCAVLAARFEDAAGVTRVHEIVCAKPLDTAIALSGDIVVLTVSGESTLRLAGGWTLLASTPIAPAGRHRPAVSLAIRATVMEHATGNDGQATHLPPRSL